MPTPPDEALSFAFSTKLKTDTADTPRAQGTILPIPAAVARAIPGTEVSVNPDAPPDKRSYRVSFERFAALAPDWRPRRSLEEVIGEIASGLRAIGFADARFREGRFIRLHTLDRHRREGLLDGTLRWEKD